LEGDFTGIAATRKRTRAQNVIAFSRQEIDIFSTLDE
jgi:hypothetical protein